MQIKYIHAPIQCAHCGKRAKTGWLIGGKTYAVQCASDECGLRVETLKQLAKEIQNDSSNV